MIVLVACSGTVGPSTTRAVPTSTSTSASAPLVTPIKTDLSPEVSAYLEEAYAVMFENAVRRNEIDWVRFRSMYEDAIAAVAPTSVAEAHRVIRRALLWLLDQHSTFFSPEEVSEWADPPTRTVDFEPSLLEGRYAYLTVPWFSTSSEAAINDYATELQAAIAGLYAQGACGWIVDLRDNLGGTMWPMVAGLGPLLGEGKFGANIGPDGDNIPWVYEKGEAWWGDEVLAQTLEPPFEFPSPFPPTAVLMGGRTASAGEATAIAFVGRPGARSFGQPTAGLTSAPEPYHLSDGSILFLADSYMGDRNGVPYPRGIEPDALVPTGDALEGAIEWLESQDECN